MKPVLAGSVPLRREEVVAVPSEELSQKDYARSMKVADDVLQNHLRERHYGVVPPESESTAVADVMSVLGKSFAAVAPTSDLNEKGAKRVNKVVEDVLGNYLHSRYPKEKDIPISERLAVGDVLDAVSEGLAAEVEMRNAFGVEWPKHNSVVSARAIQLAQQVVSKAK